MCVWQADAAFPLCSVKKAKERHKKQSKTKGGGGNDDGDGRVGLQVGSAVEVCCGGR